MSTGFGQQTPYDKTSPLAEISFIIRQMTARMTTMKLVSVVAVHSGGGALAVAGTVDVLPLVSQVDGNNNAQPHGTVFGIQYFRLQGGVNAVICDPAVGDVGFVVCADRDSTNVNNGQSTTVTPGSYRRFDLQDGVYVGGILNAKPKQYVQFTSNGVNIADENNNQIQMGPNGITLSGPGGNQISITSSGISIVGLITEINGSFQTTGNISTSAGNITATSGNISAPSGSVTAGVQVSVGGHTLTNHFHGYNEPTGSSIAANTTLPSD